MKSKESRQGEMWVWCHCELAFAWRRYAIFHDSAILGKFEGEK